MGDYRNNRCHECDGTGGNHYAGCDFDGDRGSGRLCGSDLGKACFFLILFIGAFVTALCPPLGIGIIVLGAKITGV